MELPKEESWILEALTQKALKTARFAKFKQEMDISVEKDDILKFAAQALILRENFLHI